MEGLGDIFGVIFWDLGFFGGFLGAFWGGLRPSVELRWRLWRSLGSLGSWSVLGSWGAIWGAETNFWGQKDEIWGLGDVLWGFFRVF